MGALASRARKQAITNQRVRGAPSRSRLVAYVSRDTQAMHESEGERRSLTVAARSLRSARYVCLRAARKQAINNQEGGDAPSRSRLVAYARRNTQAITNQRVRDAPSRSRRVTTLGGYASDHESEGERRSLTIVALKLATSGENRLQLMRRHDLQLRVGAIGRLLVRAPSAKVRHVAEAGTLHVLVGDFGNQFGTDRLPREVLALAPTALPAGQPMHSFGLTISGPLFPRVAVEGVLAVWHEKLRQFAALLLCKAGADADVLQATGIVKESEQQRADFGLRPLLIPAESRHHAVAIALMLDLEHDALVGLVGDRERLGHDAIEPRAFEAVEPVLRHGRILGGRRDVDRRLGGSE